MLLLLVFTSRARVEADRRVLLNNASNFSPFSEFEFELLPPGGGAALGRGSTLLISPRLWLRLELMELELDDGLDLHCQGQFLYTPLQKFQGNVI